MRTSETEALCAKVSEFRGEWREDYDAPCGSCGHRKVCHGRNRGCAVWQFDGHTCGCAIYQPQPLDWTLPENAWKLLEDLSKPRVPEMYGLLSATAIEARIFTFTPELVLLAYCRAHGLTTSTEGR